MIRIMSSLGVLAGLLALGLLAEPAHAQLSRTYVSAASGDDAADCSRATPCRNFQRAHDNTLANGEITVLDPGGYGTVTITKTISIINDGVGEAGMLVSGGLAGITINAGAGDAVSLRGLTVKGIGYGGGIGILFNTGKSLTVENCVVRNLTGRNAFNFNGSGIIFQPHASSTLAVSNTLVADNEAAGIGVYPVGAGTVSAAFSRVEAYNNGGDGITVGAAGSSGTINAVVTDSVAANNNLGGFVVTSGGYTFPVLIVRRSMAANNGTGLIAGNRVGIAMLRVSQSIVTGNATGWQVNGLSLLHSFGDNDIDGNLAGEAAPPTLVKK